MQREAVWQVIRLDPGRMFARARREAGRLLFTGTHAVEPDGAGSVALTALETHTIRHAAAPAIRRGALDRGACIGAAMRDISPKRARALKRRTGSREAGDARRSVPPWCRVNRSMEAALRTLHLKSAVPREPKRGTIIVPVARLGFVCQSITGKPIAPGSSLSVHLALG
jgi:hypothetical protein